MVAHQEAGMAMVKNPAKALGENIRRIDNARDVVEGDVAKGAPVL